MVGMGVGKDIGMDMKIGFGCRYGYRDVIR